MKTQYIYKGCEISHIDFLHIMRAAGLQSGHRKSHFEHLTKVANSGNVKAQNILTNLTVKQ